MSDRGQPWASEVSQMIHDGMFDEDVTQRFDKLIVEERVVLQAVYIHRLRMSGKGERTDDLKIAVSQKHHIKSGEKEGTWIVTDIQGEYRGSGL